MTILFDLSLFYSSALTSLGAWHSVESPQEVFMLGSLGAPELIVIFLVALIVFGPTKLPEFGKSLGEAIRGFKKAINEPDKTPIESSPTTREDNKS